MLSVSLVLCWAHHFYYSCVCFLLKSTTRLWPQWSGHGSYIIILITGHAKHLIGLPWFSAVSSLWFFQGWLCHLVGLLRPKKSCIFRLELIIQLKDCITDQHFTWISLSCLCNSCGTYLHGKHLYHHIAEAFFGVLNSPVPNNSRPYMPPWPTFS